MPRKAQVSVEYMFMMGFATLITIPLLIVYYSYTSDSGDLVATGQALQIARSVVDSSESVYYLGKPSQTTLKLNFPASIQSTNLSNREVLLRIRTQNGINDIFQVSSVNMSGSLPTAQGIHIITVKAEDGYVQITSN